ncbi:hypothetical protein [Salinicola avicenniae]|uniref:hypothetical protein n=1 Tax=Salinicola avicenniae TaxID=2916836 RepID=UPI0020739433|nr:MULTISPECIES: hypothetical protein [unclassified Salinicola]
MHRQTHADDVFDLEVRAVQNVAAARKIDQLSTQLAASNALLRSVLDQLDEARAEIEQLRSERTDDAVKSALLKLPDFFRTSPTERIRQQVCPISQGHLG